MSGGSTATATVIPSVMDAADAAIKVLLGAAISTKGSPFFGKDLATLALTCLLYTSRCV